MELKTLFSPAKIGRIQIKNRIVRSATYETLADKKGYVTDELIKLYSGLAQGGTGLIITGFSAVDSEGIVGPKAICLYDDSYILGQKKLVEAVHEYSDVKISTQLAHCGRQILSPKVQPVAPSPIADKMVNRTPRELTTNEVKEMIKKFVDAGRRAYESGYDMVQIHAAHGYLLSLFISPYSNKRTDEFGSDTQKRTKILVDIYNGILDEVGKNFPIIIKMQTQDDVLGGLEIKEAKDIAKILVKTGYDAIEPSGGMYESRLRTKRPLGPLPSKMIKSPDDEAYLLPNAEELKPVVDDCPIILVGGIKDPLLAEKILLRGTVDFISMSRPLIREIDLPNRWRGGDLSPSTCFSCNKCLFNIGRKNLQCASKKSTS